MKCDEFTTPIKIEIPGIGTIESKDLLLKVEVDEAISELKETQRWRNCSEELPEKDKYVLAFCPNLKSIEIARILDDEWRDFSWNYLEVTHWMPLPSAPKEVK